LSPYLLLIFQIPTLFPTTNPNFAIFRL